MPSGVAIVVPARDEGAGLRDALVSLTTGQKLPPAIVVVVVNNSTDDTEDVARAYAAESAVPVRVLVMPGKNTFKKAGALNYGISQELLSGNGQLRAQYKYLLVMDGDTELHPEFLCRAVRILKSRPDLGGLSASCLGKKDLPADNLRSRLILAYQRLEYSRCAHSRIMRNVHTMSGAGSVYRAEAVNDVLKARGELFEQRVTNLVEDYETTLFLKALGWGITANQACIAYTDLMPTMPMLKAQRLRWLRGTVDEWRRYGFCRSTRRSISGMLLSLIAFLYVMTWVAEALFEYVTVHSFDARYMALMVFWAAYQGIAVRFLGWRAILFEASLIPEMLCSVVRNYWAILSIFKSFTSKRPHEWAR